jgi:hypothetical protein
MMKKPPKTEPLDMKVQDPKKAQKALTEKKAERITNLAGKHKYAGKQ